MSHKQLKPINGLWIQTIAYQIDHIQDTLEAYIASGGTGTETTGETQVVITETKTSPRETVTVYEKYEPNIVRKPTTVVKKVNYVKPPTKTIIIKDAYTRVCGSWNPIKSSYKNCTRCVDAFITANPNTPVGEMTRSGTGCSTTNNNNTRPC